MSSGVVLLQRVEEYKKRQARALRKNMTEAERVLCEQLRNRRLDGLKFRRQQVIEGFIIDFFCHELKLVVETDGEIHDTPKQKEIDEHRKNVFESRSLKEIRFKNSDVLNNISYVLSTIRK
jgi:very-short-patch-repair endonuclease